MVKTGNETYVNIGKSSYSALNRTNRVTKGSVSLVVAIAIELPRVPTTASSLKMKSRMDNPLFIPLTAVDLFLPSSTPSTSASVLNIFAWKRGLNQRLYITYGGRGTFEIEGP